MSILQALILGIIQGLTEFLPISSSGHLLLVQKAMGISDIGFVFDVALHLGTLIALIIFFFKDIRTLIKAVFVKTKQTRLAWLIIIATIPAAVIGYLLEGAAESKFRSPLLVAVNLAVFGFVILAAENYAQRYKQLAQINTLTKKEAITMGFAQAVAVVPGVSRSGATITAGIFIGVDRVSATRFSFLLGIPITAGAILKVLLKHSTLSLIHHETTIFFVGIAAAFTAGILAIKFMLNYLAKHDLTVFAYYRFAVATLIILILALS